MGNKHQTRNRQTKNAASRILYQIKIVMTKKNFIKNTRAEIQIYDGNGRKCRKKKEIANRLMNILMAMGQRLKI